MDKIEQIVALASAGFSKAEIAALMASTDPTAKEPEKAKEPDPKPEKVKEPDPKPTPEPKPNPDPNPINEEVQKLFESIGMKLDNLANSVHLANINQGGATPSESVDDILASIINPPEYNRKGDK